MQNLSWKIGDVDITQVVEMEEYDIFSTFIPEATPDLVKKIDWLSPHFITSDGKLKGLVQSFLIQSNGKNILVDTCNGNDKERPTVPTWGNLQIDYLTLLSKTGIIADEIDLVICTHMHFDHIGWNTQLKNESWIPTFPNAKYLFSKGEYDYWMQQPKKELKDDRLGFADSIKPIVNAGLAQFVSDDHVIDSNIRFISTPGHTPHHISVTIESQGTKAVISGDVLHHPCQIAYVGLEIPSDTDPKGALQTRKALLKNLSNSDTLLIGSHFNYPVAGYVIEENGEMKLRIDY